MKTWWNRMWLGVLAVILGSMAVSTSALAASNSLVISQIYSGENIGTPYVPRARYDFIEIFNRGTTPVNLTGWSLQVAPPQAGASWVAIPLSGSIAPGQYYLIQGVIRGGFATLPQPDATSNLDLLALGGRVALMNNTIVFDSECPAAVAIDMVTYGSSSCSDQGVPNSGVAMDSENALVRKDGGCLDSDGPDLSLVPAYPRTSSTPRNVCSDIPALKTFNLPTNGGVSVQTTGAGATLGVGQIRIQSSEGTTTPNGLAIFSLRQGATLISEASVPAVPLIRTGQVYVEASGPINTGVAISNPNDSDVLIQFQLFDSTRGLSNYIGRVVVPARGQLARFINELPYSLVTPLQGTLEITASAPVGIVALRGYTNERGEFLVTTLPVIDTSTPVIRETSYLAHFAVSGGWRTEIVLMGRTDETATGTVEFLDAAGRPANVRIGTQTATSFGYSLLQKHVVKLTVTGATPDILTGSVRIVPTSGTPVPVALAVFSYTRNNVRVSEAGLVSIRGSRFRTYVEYSGAVGVSGSIQPGLAIANTGADPITVNLELSRLDGTSTGLAAAIVLPGSGQVAKFLNELFPTLSGPFQGILRVSTAGSISLIGLRGRYNERNDFLITTVPGGDESAAVSSAELSFPHLADSAGYSTQFILFGPTGLASTGSLRLFTPGGQPLAVEFK